ncbi:unnamed protein product, partial [Ostreobium quekettii]
SRDQAARSTLQSDDAPHEETSLNDIFETLATWIRKEGGYVHDTLRLVKKDNRRGRGVITTQLISGDLLKCPAILIPESRVLASSSAADLLGEKIDESARQNLANFDGDLQLGLFLAHERNKGAPCRNLKGGSFSSSVHETGTILTYHTCKWIL